MNSKDVSNHHWSDEKQHPRNNLFYKTCKCGAIQWYYKDSFGQNVITGFSFQPSKTLDKILECNLGDTRFIDIKEDAWDLAGMDADILCITTNGFIKKDGTNVMGAGIAKEASQRFWSIKKILGGLIKDNGNIVQKILSKGENISFDIYAFPVKHKWMESADLDLIKKSCEEIVKVADDNDYNKIIIPRPGCGNGDRDWETEVKPILLDLLDNRFIIVNKGSAKF